MATPTSAALIAAARDSDLRERLVALGRTRGHTQGDIELALARLVAHPVTDTGDTIASVFEYAVSTYEPTPRPGQNPGAVTDAYLLEAIDQEFNSPQN